jgi:cytochrome P450
MLRLVGVAASVRTLTADTIISGRVLRRGRRVIIPYRQLHFDTGVFGTDVAEFRPGRRLDKDGTRLGPLASRTDHFRPFGGGSTICPGRFIAKRTVTTFVALVLRRFDITLAGEQHFPVADFWRPVLGIMDSKLGEDVRVRLIPKKEVV